MIGVYYFLSRVNIYIPNWVISQNLVKLTYMRTINFDLKIVTKGQDYFEVKQSQCMVILLRFIILMIIT